VPYCLFCTVARGRPFSYARLSPVNIGVSRGIWRKVDSLGVGQCCPGGVAEDPLAFGEPRDAERDGWADSIQNTVRMAARSWPCPQC
jgi:hypothetical protein